eukprot:3562427-Prymnesium_polylepis.1
MLPRRGAALPPSSSSAPSPSGTGVLSRMPDSSSSALPLAPAAFAASAPSLSPMRAGAGECCGGSSKYTLR